MVKEFVREEGLVNLRGIPIQDRVWAEIPVCGLHTWVYPHRARYAEKYPKVDCIACHTHTGQGIGRNNQKWIAYLVIPTTGQGMGKNTLKVDCIPFESFFFVLNRKLSKMHKKSVF